MPSSRPLFITRFSLSRKTAIGTQTRHLMDVFPDARHLHWEDVELGRRDQRSILVESFLAARLGLLKRTGPVREIASRMGLLRWKSDRLSPHDEVFIRGLGADTSAIYVAPIDGADSRRMRYLVEVLDRPFCLHIWDMLDGAPKPGSDLSWLIENAHAVFALCEQINVAIGQPGAPLLGFSRPPSDYRATLPSPRGPLRIALLGDVASYKSGLRDMVEADTQLKSMGVSVEWIYIGSSAILRRVDGALTAPLRPTGFFRNDADRDKELASCHIAFLPGPKGAPESDTRSAYSIPSRILDFAAIGLPVVGVVHAESATARYAAGYQDELCLMNGIDLASGILRIVEAARWQMAATRSFALYERSQAAQSPARLKSALSAAAL